MYIGLLMQLLFFINSKKIINRNLIKIRVSLNGFLQIITKYEIL